MEATNRAPLDPTAGPLEQRMVHQGLWQPTATEPGDVVRALVAMQAQEFAYALWSVAQRMDRAVTASDLLRDFDDGAILRTHVLRPTWHFALPEDIRWLIRLTAPRLRRLMASYSRQHGLDAAALSAAEAVLARAVDGGRHRTRKELVALLESAGIPTAGLRLGFILMHAEYDEVLISGAMRGKQQTYAAFDERVPPGADLDEDEALAELARRYVAGRAPVTAKDLAGWASLTLAQARCGLAAVESECTVGDIDGMTVYLGGRPPARTGESRSPVVDLIQGYDEVIMSYSQSRGLITGGGGQLPVPDRSIFMHAILVDGTLAGYWRHQIGRDRAEVQTQLRRPLTEGEQAALHAAVARYAAFLGRPTNLAEPELLG